MITHWKDKAPTPPYYAVIFISKKAEQLEGYAEMDDYLMQEAHKQDGFLGYSSQGSNEGSIFISYWRDEESIASWRNHSEHLKAKSKAFEIWYDYLHSMICKVESSHIFIRNIEELL